MSNPIRKLVGQTAIYGLSSIIGRLLNYLLVPLYVSVFAHASDYGIVSELYAWVAFLMVLLTFGMETAYFKFISEHPDRKDSIFRNALLSVLSVNALFFLLIIILSKFLAQKMLFPDNPEFVILLSAVVMIDAVSSLPMARLRAEEKAKKFAIINLIGIGINIILNLILMLIVFHPKTQDAAVGIRFIFIANILASMVKPIALYKDFFKLKFVWDTKLIRSMIAYSLPLMLAGFAYIVNETVDRILLKYLSYHTSLTEMASHVALTHAEAQVGIYSASYKLAMLVTIFLQAYRYAAEPFFFSQSKSKDRNLLYRKVMNYFVAVVFIAFLVVSLNIDFFKYFIPNEAYWEGLRVVPILLLANVWSGVYINQSIWYKLSGQTKFGAYIAIVGAIITLILNFAFIPKYGYMACAWTTFAVYAGQMVASYILGQKHYPIPYNIKRFLFYSGLAILIYLGVSSMHLSPSIFQFVLHNSFILLFILVLFFVERREGIKLKEEI